jgi:1,4-dihydroxy-2-naphthoate octaprenyltransferase
MSQKLYLIVSGFIFLLVGILHLLRLVNHWPIVVGSTTIPYALSYAGCPISIGYSVWAAWLLFAATRARSRRSR